MKRVLIGAGLIVALAFPATIIADIRHYEGTVDEGGTTSFVTKVRHGKTIKVRQFVFKHVPMQCDDGALDGGRRRHSSAGHAGQFEAQVPRQLHLLGRPEAAAHRWQGQGIMARRPGAPCV